MKRLINKIKLFPNDASIEEKQKELDKMKILDMK